MLGEAARGEHVINQGLLVLLGVCSILALQMRMRLSAYGLALVLAAETVLFYGLWMAFWDKVFVKGFGSSRAQFGFLALGHFYQAVCASLISMSTAFGKLGLF